MDVADDHLLQQQARGPPVLVVKEIGEIDRFVCVSSNAYHRFWSSCYWKVNSCSVYCNAFCIATHDKRYDERDTVRGAWICRSFAFSASWTGLYGSSVPVC